jgi:hypothetical protein
MTFRTSVRWHYPTVLLGHARQPFPEWEPNRKIEEVSDDRVSLGSRWIRQGILRSLSQQVPHREDDEHRKDERYVTWIIQHDDAIGVNGGTLIRVACGLY